MQFTKLVTRSKFASRKTLFECRITNTEVFSDRIAMMINQTEHMICQERRETGITLQWFQLTEMRTLQSAVEYDPLISNSDSLHVTKDH